MVEQILKRGEKEYEWLHISEPTQEEIDDIAARYSLSPSSVVDCLQPGHFPKYETFDDYHFIVFRSYIYEGGGEVDTIRSITTKIALFYNESFLISVSSKPSPIIEKIKEKWQITDRVKNSFNLVVTILHACLRSYNDPTEKLSQRLDYYEEQVFIRQGRVPILKGLYYVKREVDVIRRVLILSFEIIDKIDAERSDNVYTRDLRDLYIKLQNTFDNLSENTAQLLSVYFSTSSQRTNEIMRVLTVFSVFFMPLTFIVGIYGMNFHAMPELDWSYGYPLVMALMALITLLIYLWFKKKKWL